MSVIPQEVKERLDKTADDVVEMKISQARSEEQQIQNGIILREIKEAMGSYATKDDLRNFKEDIKEDIRSIEKFAQSNSKKIDSIKEKSRIIEFVLGFATVIFGGITIGKP